MKIALELLKRLGTRDKRNTPSAVTPAPLLMALEPRIVYDASVAAVGAAQHHVEASAHVAGIRPQILHAAELVPAVGSDSGDHAHANTQARSLAQAHRDIGSGPQASQVVFINSNVANYQELITGLPSGTRYVILNANRDGLQQIAQYLQEHPGVSSIHLVSHGTDGAFQVGDTWLSESSLSAHSAELAQIGAAMKAGGDFLIYGCDVARNADGKALVQQISSISGLNVAASTDATGATTLGGDWVLEYDAGTVHTGVVFSAASERNYDHVLSAFDETYDGSVGFDTGTTPVASTTIGLLTYTGDQAVEYQVVSGSLPSSGSGGELVVNTQGTQMSTLTIQRQDGSSMAIESFDIDIFVSNEVTVQALDGSGNVVGSVVLDLTAGATPYTPGHISNSSLFHVDLSSNAAFSQVKSIKLVETSGNGTFLSPTLDNFTYLAPSSPPTLTASGGTTSFVAGDNVASTPVVIDSGITLADGNSTTALSATVSITGNLHNTEDMLSFTNTSGATYGNIAAVYNATTGVLTLSSASGTATIAQWQAALRAVTYTDTAVTPSSAARAISFEITSDGFTAGNTTTKAVSVTDTDQTPIVTATGRTTNYSEGAVAITIDSGITVSDSDSTTQASGTVSVSGGFHSGDTLGFTNNGSTMGNIAASYNAATGVMTLTSAGATATDAQWANALKAVTFSSTSTTFGARTISFATSDGTKTSTAATDTINVVNPVQVTTDSGSAAFVAGDNTASTPVAIDAGLTVTDTAATTLGSATVAITGNYTSGEDLLTFTNNGTTMGNISASFNPATGVMTLTSSGATATVAQWENALRSVTYTDTAVTPYNATRTVSFTITDSLSNTSATSTRTVTVTDTDQTPIVTTTGGTTNYVGASSPVTIDSGILVSDLDNTTQASGTVSVSGGFHSGDTLGFVNDGSTMGNITASYNAATGVLTLTSSGATATDAQWASALKSVTFSSTSNTYGNRTISFATSDGTKTSTSRTDTVNITEPPTITTDSGSAAFVAGDNVTSTPVAIDAGLTVTDGSATTLGSTTVAITGGFHSGEDVLAFTNNGTTMGNITASYNAATGVMTLTSASATATLAQWQSALQSVTYTDTAITPNNTTRTISFAAVDGVGNTSATATRTVTVTDTDQTPIVTTTGGTTNYVGATSAVTIDGGISITDRDNTTQTSGTVSISGGFHSGDTLGFTNNGTTMGNIVGSYNAATGVLTLTSSGSTATDAQWANALSAVTFSSTSNTYGNRTISFATSDGTKTSTAATDTVNITAPPTITTDSGSAAFVAGDNTPSTPVTIDAGLTVTDGSATTLGSVTVAITGGFHSGEDVLAFTNDGSTMGNITASYNAATGVMTLTSASATATLAQWQSALQSVTYTDTTITPNNATRTISFTAVDGASNTSATATRTVTVTDTDQTPIVTTTGGTTNYVGGTSAATIDGGISVTDRDNTTQSTGTVAITSGFHAGDTLTFVNSSSATYDNIVASYNAATGVLTLTSSGGTASDLQWSNALSSVTFSAGSSATPGTRTISFATSDGVKNSAAATDTVALLGPPTITTDSGSAAFVAGDNTVSTPVAIDSGLTLTDGAAPTLASATVAITGNFHSGEDVLAFTNTSAATFGNIAASYSASTGVLTLTSSGASATLAQWQAALEAVTYTDTAITPNTTTRTISFTALDTGAVTSNTATRTVTVTDTDQTPIVTTTGGTTNYVGGTSAATIDGGISVTDRDNTTQSTGTVAITSGFHAGDTLTFVNSSSATYDNIVASYNAATGVLTLTSSGGTASDLQWSNALSSVTFSAGSSATPGTRTISFATSDGVKNSAAATDTVALLGPPTITTDSGSAAFVAGDNTVSTPVAIDSGLTMTDGAAPTLASATVAITGNFHGGEDVLAFTNTNSATYGNIAASYNAATGVLTLTSTGATATFAQWQNALDSVTYTDTAITPNTATRTVSFAAVDTSAVISNTATRTVTVTDTDQTPIVATSSGSTSFVAGDNTASAPVQIDHGIALSDRDNTTLASATVAITGNFNASEDLLAFTNDGATMGNIAASYNAATGVMTLTSTGATATVAQWQAALASVTYTDTAVTPNSATRTVSFTVSDGLKTSVAGTKSVTVTDTDQTPILTTPSGSVSFVAADNAVSTPVLIDTAITLSDRDNTTLASATVAITGNFHSGEDVLAFTNDGATMGNISASYNAATGVLTLTSSGATATLGQWQAALDSVTYTDTAVTPNNATRTIGFAVSDGIKTSAAATRTVTVTDTDQTPIVTTSTGSASFVAGDNTVSTPVHIDSGIALSDRDNTTLASATVAITGNFHSGEDVLAFTNDGATMGNISASYNAATGVLTLTSSGATATMAQWQAALASVTYTDTAVTPNNATRTISFTVSDGVKTSVAGTKSVTVTDTDQTPIVTTSTGNTSFVAGDNAASTPVQIDGGIALSDHDNTTLASATVAITGNFHSSEDVLAFTNDGATMGNIAASYNAATGVMTLTSTGATATVAQWQAALASVTYTDTAVTPNSATRTVSFTVSDGLKTSVAGTKSVTVTDTDQTPILTTPSGSVSFVAADNAVSTPVLIDTAITLSDRDNTTLASATVAITGNFHSGEDVLAFTNDGATMGNISASYNAATGVLTLTSSGATATLGQWQAALDSVTYTDTAVTPNNATRTIGFAVSDGIKTSAAATRTVTVADVDQTPIVTTSSGSVVFGGIGHTSPVLIDPYITVSDRDNATLASATVSIVAGLRPGEDRLLFVNDSTTMGDITGSYNAATGVLTLTSAGNTATLAQWQTALASVAYADISLTAVAGNRTIAFEVNDGTLDSADTIRSITVNAAFKGRTVVPAEPPVLPTATLVPPNTGEIPTSEPVVLTALAAERMPGEPMLPFHTTTFTAPGGQHANSPDMLGGTQVGAQSWIMPAPIAAPFNVPVTTEHHVAAPGAKFTLALAPWVDTNAQVIAVTQGDGRALPGWLHYDPASRQLQGHAPMHGHGPHQLSLVIATRDQQGHQHYREVVLDFGGKHATVHHAARHAPRHAAKLSLKEQFEREQKSFHVVRPAPVQTGALTLNARTSTPATHT
jgi:hypothetical protein